MTNGTAEWGHELRLANERLAELGWECPETEELLLLIEQWEALIAGEDATTVKKRVSEWYSRHDEEAVCS